MSKSRDWVARSPLMQKGGPHTKSKTGQRVRARLNLDQALCDYYEEVNIDIDEKEKIDGEPTAPRSLFDAAFREIEIMYH